MRGCTLTYKLIGNAPVGVSLAADGTFTVIPQASDQALDTGESRKIIFQFMQDGKRSNTQFIASMTPRQIVFPQEYAGKRSRAAQLRGHTSPGRRMRMTGYGGCGGGGGGGG